MQDCESSSEPKEIRILRKQTGIASILMRVICGSWLLLTWHYVFKGFLWWNADERVVIFFSLATGGSLLLIGIELAVQAVQDGKLWGQHVARILFFLHFPTPLICVAAPGIYISLSFRNGIGIHNPHQLRRVSFLIFWPVALILLAAFGTVIPNKGQRDDQNRLRENLREHYEFAIRQYIIRRESIPQSTKDLSAAIPWRSHYSYTIKQVEHGVMPPWRAEFKEDVFESSLAKISPEIPQLLREARELREAYAAAGSTFSDQRHAFRSSEMIPPDSVWEAWNQEDLDEDLLIGWVFLRLWEHQSLSNLKRYESRIFVERTEDNSRQEHRKFVVDFADRTGLTQYELGLAVFAELQKAPKFGIDPSLKLERRIAEWVQGLHFWDYYVRRREETEANLLIHYDKR